MYYKTELGVGKVTICKNCNAVIEDKAKVCHWCGAQVTPESKQEKRKPRVLLWLVVTMSIALFLFMLLPMLHFGGGTANKMVSNQSLEKVNVTTSPTEINKAKVTAMPLPSNDLYRDPDHNLYYLKGNKVYRSYLDDLKPEVVINSLFHNQEMSDSIVLSKDGSKLFYPQNHQPEASNVSVFRYDMDSSDNERSRIDSSINGYTINDEGNKIYYFKDNDLYYSDMNKSKKIDTNVTECLINQKGNWIFYYKNDGSVYQKKGNEDKQLIANNGSIQYASPDFNTIYYIQEQTLYRLEYGRDLVKIADGVVNLYSVYSDGTIYYLRSKEVKAADYVDDDMAVPDAKMKMPIRASYADYNKYEAARSEYQQKLTRDTLRDKLSMSSTQGNWYDLYIYSNSQSKLIGNGCINVWGITNQKQTYGFNSNYAGDTIPMLFYSQLKKTDINKIKISKIKSVEDVFHFISDEFSSKQEYFYCVRDKKIKKIGEGAYSDFVISPKQDGVYYIKVNKKHGWVGDLYYSSLNETSITDGEMREKNVYVGSNFFLGDRFLYFNNVDESNSMGDMYMDGKKIDSNVYIYQSFENEPNAGLFVYVKNVVEDSSSFTVMLYKDKKTYKIADHVSSYKVIGINTLVYVSGDVAAGNNENLYIYDGKKTKLIDRGVNRIISPSKNIYFAIRGMYNSNW